jgi:hypothetical protein
MTRSNNVDKEILLAEDQLRASDPDLRQEALKAGKVEPRKCPFSGKSAEGPVPYQYIPLRMGGRGGTHVVSAGSRALIENEVSLEDLRGMTNAFYELAFEDATIDKFLRSHDDPHGDRFAKWIHQKLSGSSVWDEDRQQRDLTPVEVANGRRAVVHDRSSAHSAAWYSPKRPQKEVGRRFRLDECRIWMRLHFLGMRNSGLMEKSPSFCDYYVRFIGHFVGVYEKSAPTFAKDSFRWSENPKNVETYIKNGRVMKDVLGVDYWHARDSLPEEELADDEWPYHQYQ